MKTLENTVEELKTAISELLNKYNDLAASVQFNSDETDEIKTKINSLDSLQGKADLNDKKCKQIEKNIDECYERLDITDYNQHRNEVEVTGIPETNLENLPEILNAIGEQLDLQNLSDAVVSAERLGTARNSNRNDTRNVLIKFWSIKFRDEFVSRGRAFMKRPVNHSNRPGNIPSFKFCNSYFRCFFNDYLSPPKKKLLSQCKKYGRCVSLNVVFYTRCNQIYAKRQNDSPPVIIRKLDDLNSI